jgi:predicted transcriptional regulator
MSEDSTQNTLEKTTEIVAAFVSKNQTSTADLPALIQAVHRALTGISVAAPEPEPRKEPAVPIRRSITPDHIVCLEDGKTFKSLKRHLRTKYDLSPEDYRAKWGLPKDYPMVAPNYAAARSALAKNMGLGKGGRQPVAAAPAPKAKRASKAAG